MNAYPPSLIELAEAEAYANLMPYAPAPWGFHAEQSDFATTLVAPGLDVPLFNRVIGIGVHRPATERELDAALARFHQAHIRNFAIQVSPGAQPSQLGEWLAARQLAVRDNWAKLARSGDPEAPVTTDLRIEQIGAARAGTFGRVACEAFRMPPHLEHWLAATVGAPGWIHYLAWDGAVPVATAALRVRASVGWLGIAATLPSHRRRGAQGALLARRIRDGRVLGCTRFVTETSEDLPERPNPSYRNIVRAGFALVYQRSNYMRTADA